MKYSAENIELINAFIVDNNISDVFQALNENISESEFNWAALNYTQFRDLFNLKDQLIEYSLTCELDAFKEPVLKPVKPVDVEERIRMTSFVGVEYGRIIASGCDITVKHVMPETSRILVHNHVFELSDHAMEQLRRDGMAYIFDRHGFPYISSAEQIERKKLYIAQGQKYQSYLIAVSRAFDLIENEKYADQCNEQHTTLSQLPFGYYVAIKVNVRLLTVRRIGDGAKSQTVRHIVPNETLKGRLKRNANEYLCGGGSSYGSPSENEDALLGRSSAGLFKRDVTCKKCLEIASRMVSNSVSHTCPG